MPAMAGVAAAAGVGVIIMHNQQGTDYPDGVMAAIDRFFTASLRRADEAGIPRARLMLDPGIGFGKTPPRTSRCWVRWRRSGATACPSSSAPRASR
jgi:dihydropteroate synthase